MNLPTWPLAIRVAGVVIAVGALANGLTIALNGRMPYEPAAAEAVGLRPDLTTPKNEPADDATRLAFLADTIPVTPQKKVVGAGDVLIGAGTVALTALAMRRRDQPHPVPQLITGGEHDSGHHLAPGRLRDAHVGVAGPAALHDRRPIRARRLILALPDMRCGQRCCCPHRPHHP